MFLFIVESPTKAKTISRILGKGFIVKATLGHIKDLPEDDIGVDERTLKARYVYLRGKKKIVEDLKRLARRSRVVYIGTDPDREGEAIAYFLKEELKDTGADIKRVIFYEITERALRKGIREAGDINMNLVRSQFARRILDRLIGYRISPVLWKELGSRNLSAGRVQSPALRLIVDREEEIRNFKRRKYYYVKVLLEKDGKTFEAVYDYRYSNPSDAKEVEERIKDGIFMVASVTRKEERVPPPRPFITSSLQSEGSSKLGLPPERIQSIAQSLYEEGFITYPRTDSYRMSGEAVRMFMEFISHNFGKEYLGKRRKFRDMKTAQGAHECIRPTSPYRRPEKGREVYDLILRRTLASLMSDMILQKTEVSIEVVSPALKRPISMVAKGVKVLFEGWTRVYPHEVQGQTLPDLREGDRLKVLKVFIEEKVTQPPPRYTEGTLVKTLEKLGIGRPSTYAVIVKTLKERGYVRVLKRTIHPTEKGVQVAKVLKERFPVLMDYSFTARMEDELDKVEEGRRNWKEVVRELFKEVMAQGGLEPPTPRFSAGCSTN